MSSHLIQYMTDNQKSLVKYITKLVNCHEAAEDVFQDSVEAILSYNCDGIEEEDAPKYVYTVIKRMANSHKVKEAKRLGGKEEHTDQVDLTFLQLHEDSLEDCQDPLDKLIAEDKSKIIPELIEAHVRSDEHRNLLEMILIEGVSMTTAAELCGLTYNHARVIMHRFVKKVSE